MKMKKKIKTFMPDNNNISIAELSEINNLNDLRKKILSVKATVLMQEEELNERLKRLPKEATTAVFSSAMPMLFAKGVPVKTWGLLKNALDLFLTFRYTPTIKGAVTNTAKGVGIISIAKTILSILSNRKRKNKD